MKDPGTLIHAGVGLAAGVAAVALIPFPFYYEALAFVTIGGFLREVDQAGSFSNLTMHKVIEGVAWSACWLGLVMEFIK